MATARSFPYHIVAQGGITAFNNPGGQVWYVGASGYVAAGGGSAPADTLSGKSPQKPFATIQKGLDSAVAGRGDIVAVLPGAYTITAALTMSKDDVTLTAAQSVGPHEYPNVTIVCATDVSEIEINANNCTVASLAFDDNVTAATVNTAIIDVNTASTATDYTGTRIINCWFDMVGMTDSDKDGIILGTDATDGALKSLVQGCTILDAGQNGITINVGSEYSEIRDCKIYDAADLTQYGVEVLATSVTIEGCDILVSSNLPGACIHNGVGAARLVANNNTLHAWGADTTAILAIATATQRTAANWLTATAVGNLADYITDNTSPSADANVAGWFAADSPQAAFDTPTDDGA